MSSRRCESGSINPWLVRALSRVWPESPIISRLQPSGSTAKSLTIRSATLAEPVRDEHEDAEDRVIEKIEGFRAIREANLCILATAMFEC